MAVREGENRQLGSQSEKLLTLEEAAKRLDLPADDVESMVRSGKLSSFRLGGNILRLKSSDVEAARAELARLKTVSETAAVKPVLARESSAPAGPVDRFADFLYYNDFYIVGLLIILTLVAIIFAL